MDSDDSVYSKIKKERSEIKANLKRTLLNIDGAWAAFGFAIVLIAVGVPIWWKTTTVYRAPLPCSIIDSLKVYNRQHFLRITILSQDYAECLQFSTQLQKNLNSNSRMINYHVQCERLHSEHMKAIKESVSVDHLSEWVSESTVIHAGTLSILLLPPKTDVMSDKKLHVSSHANLIIAASNADCEITSNVIKSLSLYEENSPVANNSVTPIHKIVSEPNYSITLTLMLPEPHITTTSWHAEAAVKQFLSPLMQQMKKIHMKVSIRSQRMYMTPLSGIKPVWSEEKEHYVVSHAHLPLSINAIETKLGSFVSTDPALHFIIYVPGKAQSPMQIYGPDNLPLESNSFIVPRWGGVIILNPPGNATTTPHSITIDSKHIMRVVLSQLYSLLPVPSKIVHPDVSYSTVKNTLMSDWQLDALTRYRVSQYYSTTSTTLQSLCELVDEISNMVVSDEVGRWVWESVADWKACGEATQEGRLREASLFCSDAHKYAHSAFFHPSMLALLYFPDNQKYAIYVPLFLPVSIPVLLSLKTLYSLAKYCLSKEKMQ